MADVRYGARKPQYAYEDPAIAAGMSNLALALFGDPESAAKQDYYKAGAEKSRAEAGKATQETGSRQRSDEARRNLRPRIAAAMPGQEGLADLIAGFAEAAYGDKFDPDAMLQQVGPARARDILLRPGVDEATARGALAATGHTPAKGVGVTEKGNLQLTREDQAADHKKSTAVASIGAASNLAVEREKQQGNDRRFVVSPNAGEIAVLSPNNPAKVPVDPKLGRAQVSGMPTQQTALGQLITQASSDPAALKTLADASLALNEGKIAQTRVGNEGKLAVADTQNRGAFARTEATGQSRERVAAGNQAAQRDVATTNAGARTGAATINAQGQQAVQTLRNQGNQGVAETRAEASMYGADAAADARTTAAQTAAAARTQAAGSRTAQPKMVAPGVLDQIALDALGVIPGARTDLGGGRAGIDPAFLAQLETAAPGSVNAARAWAADAYQRTGNAALAAQTFRMALGLPERVDNPRSYVIGPRGLQVDGQPFVPQVAPPPLQGGLGSMFTRGATPAAPAPAAAPAPTPAPQQAVPPAAERVVNQVYPTPAGNMIWTGTGWRKPQ